MLGWGRGRENKKEQFFPPPFFNFYIMQLLHYFYNFKKFKGEGVFRPNQWQSERKAKKQTGFPSS